MTTAKTIIEDALTEIGVLIPGTSIPASDYEWVTRKFNRFLQSKSCDGLNLFVKVTENFALVSGTGSYAIGSGATFDTARPMKIVKAWLREDGQDYGIAVRPMDEYYDIAHKSQQGRPDRLFYDHTIADGTDGTIYLYYVPESAFDLWIVSYKPLTTYSRIAAEDVEVPPEYESMFVSNLALQFCPRYGRQPTRELKEDARDTLAIIRSNNFARSMKGKTINITGSNASYDIEAG